MALAALLVVIAVGCGWSPPAASVGDAEISTEQLEQDVNGVREIPELAALLGTGVPEDGPVPSSVAATLLSLRISQLVLGSSYEASLARLAPADAAARRAEADTRLAAIDEQLVAQMGSTEAYDRIPASLREVLRTFLLYRETLLDEVPDDQIMTTVMAMFEGADIKVAERFGSWNATTFEVVSPEGPGESPVASDDSADS